MGYPGERRNGKGGRGKRLDSGEWVEVTEGMTAFGWSGRGEQTSPLCPLEVVEPVGPCFSHPSHALRSVCVCPISFHAFLLCILLFQGFGPLRVCEGLFPLLPSVSGNCRASFIPQRRCELLDPLGACHCEPFFSPLHMSLSFPACSELLVCPWRDLNSAPDLNI